MNRSRLRKLRWVVANLLALTAVSAFAGQVTLFEGPAFQGRGAWTTSAVPNLGISDLPDGASSLVVNDGVWQVCTDAYFRGNCAQLVPGNYSGLGRDLKGRIVSLREIGDVRTVALLTLTPDQLPVAINQAPVTVGPGLAPIVIYSGQAPVIINSSPTPVVVNPNPREVVVTAPVVTTAQVVAPVVTTAQVVTAAPVVTTAQVVAAVPVVTTVAPPLPGRVVLYQLPNFSGARAVVDHGPSPDLDWAHFGYPATSLRIESGRWLACTQIGYQGDCLVLGPGDYPALTGLLDQGIYSVRQVG